MKPAELLCTTLQSIANSVPELEDGKRRLVYEYLTKCCYHYAPNDPANNMGAVWHSYNFNYCRDTNCWNSYVKPVADRYPVVATEMGENDCQGGYVTPLMQWMDGNTGGHNSSIDLQHMGL